MRFKDEKPMWYADTEAMALELANKNLQEVQSILDKRDVIKLRSGNRPKTTTANRLALVVLYLPMVIVACMKWCCTGDIYLDSWAKRSRIFNSVLKFMGLGET